MIMWWGDDCGKVSDNDDYWKWVDDDDCRIFSEVQKGNVNVNAYGK